MRLSGSASWRFAEGVEQAPLVALFVRDATSLPVPSRAGLPPRLDVDVPDRRTVLDADTRVHAAADWMDWWAAIVAAELRFEQGAGGVDQRGWLQQMVGMRAASYDPPAFSSLLNRPALRKVVQATLTDALDWAEPWRRELTARPHRNPGQFPYDTIRASAEYVAQRRRVSPAAVRGCAVVVPVEGHWWHRVQPGGVVCSVHAAGDPATARLMLIDAFESGLAA